MIVTQSAQELHAPEHLITFCPVRTDEIEKCGKACKQIRSDDLIPVNDLMC